MLTHFNCYCSRYVIAIMCVCQLTYRPSTLLIVMFFLFEFLGFIYVKEACILYIKLCLWLLLLLGLTTYYGTP
jgi:hypothetical protein